MNRVVKFLREKAESHAVAGTLPAEYSRVCKKVESVKKEFYDSQVKWSLGQVQEWESNMSYFILYREELRRLIIGDRPQEEELVLNQLSLFV